MGYQFRNGLAKGEGVGRHVGVEEFDGERAVLHGTRLAHQLIQALLSHRAAAIRCHISTMGVARCLAVNRYLETHRLAVCARPQYQVKVTRMKAVDDAPTGLVQRDLLAAHIPLALQGPVIQGQGDGLDEVFGTLQAQVGFRRLHLVQVRCLLHALGVRFDQPARHIF